MAEIATQLVSVDRMLWEGTATMVTAQTTEGEIGILPGREPFLGQLSDHGIVVIRSTDGEVLVAAVESGFLSVSQFKVTILAENAWWAHELDESEARTLAAGDPDKWETQRAQAQMKALSRKAQLAS